MTLKSARDSLPRKSDEQPDEIADPRAMRALTHPVRIDLIEALAMYGPLTATAAAEHIGQSPTTCSFHLRQLAKYGFVASAAQPGARERPWKLERYGLRFAFRDQPPGMKAAALDAEAAFRDHYLARLQRSWDSWTDADEWVSSIGLTQVLLYATADELHEMVEDMRRVLLRHQHRLHDVAARPQHAVPVEVLAFVHPIKPGTKTEGMGNGALGPETA